MQGLSEKESAGQRCAPGSGWVGTLSTYSSSGVIGWVGESFKRGEGVTGDVVSLVRSRAAPSVVRVIFIDVWVFRLFCAKYRMNGGESHVSLLLISGFLRRVSFSVVLGSLRISLRS